MANFYSEIPKARDEKTDEKRKQMSHETSGNQEEK